MFGKLSVEWYIITFGIPSTVELDYVVSVCVWLGLKVYQVLVRLFS